LENTRFTEEILRNALPAKAHKKRKLPPWLGSFLFCFEALVLEPGPKRNVVTVSQTKSPVVTGGATRPASDEQEIYFLPFFVVFLDDFLVVFLAFLAAMALVTSFLAAECKVRQISRQRFFACV
jgi:hypothetical protein